MLKYLNGLINKGIIPKERTLSITVSPDDNGQDLTGNIKIIIDTYRHYVDCLCFIGGEHNQHELAECCKIVHKNGLKTAFYTSLYETSQINKTLTAELDYVKLGSGVVLKKDYCPFGDVEDWIEA